MMTFSKCLRAAAVGLALSAAPMLAQATETAVPVGTPAPGGVRGTGPNGATLRCRDGSYPAPGAADAACADKGGVLVRFPTRNTPTPPAAPTRQTRPQVQAAPRAPGNDSLPPGFSPWRDRNARAAEEAKANRQPADATLRCTDGTWIVRDTVSARCASHGGVQFRVNPRGGPSRRGD